MAQILFGRFFWIWIVGFLASATYLAGISIQQLWNLSKVKEYTLPKGKAFSFTQGRSLHSNVILKGYNAFDPNGGLVHQPKAKIKKPKKEDKPKPAAKSKVPGCPPIASDTKFKKSTLRRIRLKGISYTAEDPLQSVTAIYVLVKIKGSASPTPRRRRYRRRYNRRRGRRRSRRYRRRRRYNRRYSSRGRSRWQTEIFKVGEMLMNKARICAIYPTKVVIFNNRSLEQLVLREKRKKRNTGGFGTFGLAQAKSAQGPGQVRIDAVDKRTISRSTIQDWLNNPMAHAMNARIMPHYQGGRSKGLRLVWVRKNSLYSQLGLKRGDVIQTINGTQLNLSNGLKLYSQLPYSKQLKVNIIRKGVRRQLFFTIK